MPPKKVKVVDVTDDDNDNNTDADNDENTVEDQPEVIEANTEELAIDTIPEQPESENIEEEAQSTVNEPPEEKKDVRVNELVECTKCGKKMTKKTLKYTHEKTCPANPDKKQTKTKPIKEVDTTEEIMQPIGQQAPPPTKLERQKSTYTQPPMEHPTPTLAPEPKLSFEEMRHIRLKQRMDKRTQNHMSLFANAIFNIFL